MVGETTTAVSNDLRYLAGILSNDFQREGIGLLRKRTSSVLYDVECPVLLYPLSKLAFVLALPCLPKIIDISAITHVFRIYKSLVLMKMSRYHGDGHNLTAKRVLSHCNQVLICTSVTVVCNICKPVMENASLW